MTKWVSIPEYSKMTGLSRKSVEMLIETKQVISISTEGGGQTRIKIEEDENLESIKEDVKELKDLVEKLSKHLGLK